jgi:hypothetical protein
MPDQHKQDLQAVPGLPYAIKPQMIPTHCLDHREAAVHMDPNTPPSAPAAQATLSTPYILLDPDIRNCHSASHTNDDLPTRPNDDPPSATNEHSTSPSPTTGTEEPTHTMLDQYTQALQAIPNLIHAIDPQRILTYIPDHRVAANTDPTISPSALAAKATPNPQHILLKPDQPTHPPPEPQSTVDQNRTWRLRQYPLTIPALAQHHDGNN